MANVKTGDAALAFELPGVDGKSYSLSALSQGKKATAVVFMCNHCPYVLAWLDRLIAAARDYAQQDVVFAGINANDPAKYAIDDFQGMQRLAEEYGLSFPYLHDETQQVAIAYGAQRTPEVFLFDADLRLRYHGAPDDNYDESLASVPYLHNALDAVLAGQQPPVAETPPVGCTIKWKQRPLGDTERMGLLAHPLSCSQAHRMRKTIGRQRLAFYTPIVPKPAPAGSSPSMELESSAHLPSDRCGR